MNNQKHNWILYLISATILATIAIQFYWNYKNYEQNKWRILNEIQLSLDTAVGEYYADLSKKNFLTIVKPNNKKKTENFSITSIQVNNEDAKNSDEVVNIINGIEKEFVKIKGPKNLSTKRETDIHFKRETIKNAQVFRGKKASDSLKLIKNLQTIFISIKVDSLEKRKFDSIFQKQLQQKNITIDYVFNFFKNDTLRKTHFSTNSNLKTIHKITANSTFLGKNKKLNLSFTNPTREALQRSSTGILLSLLLSLAVISSLFYLLKIINQQKELAEIKNDLISNITHEFKTPITTVSTALEAINNFNVINDKEKTQTYVDISKNQVEKLHLMVEKLLETATLDSEKLLLKKEEINLVSLVEKLTKKHQLITSEKSISFNSSMNEITTTIDVFHFENAISNLIDNAIKYGGDKIDIHLSSEENKIIINVSDNGKGIEKTQQNKIFDKFYRVPKGNTHDVKGFGIGLYYTKKIIEKHNGTIDLKSNTNQTTFTISLPYEH